MYDFYFSTFGGHEISIAARPDRANRRAKVRDAGYTAKRKIQLL